VANERRDAGRNGGEPASRITHRWSSSPDPDENVVLDSLRCNRGCSRWRPRRSAPSVARPISRRAMYQRLADAASDPARILVLGYPMLFPEDVQLTCVHDVLIFNKTERRTFTSHALEVNALIQSAVADVGFEYIDIASLFATHEPCGEGGKDWVRFPGPGRVYGWFHPTEVGQEKLARAVLCHLYAHPQPPPDLAPADRSAAMTDGATSMCFRSADVFPAPPIQPVDGSQGRLPGDSSTSTT
jgi:hypothetical protein